MVAFIDGFRTFLADIIAPFFKENYPALENILLLTNFWLVIITTTAVFYSSLPKFENRELWCFESRHRILIHFSGNHRTHMNLCHTRQPHYS
jgi:hypothetical protein